MELTMAITRSPSRKGRSLRIGSMSRSTMASAGWSFSRYRPGSPWIPIPISISSSPRSKVGFPTWGTVQEVRAIPMERPFSATRRPRSARRASSYPRSAAAPRIFSARTVVPVPRRPWE